MLQRENVWNDLSPKLISKLEEKINSFGKIIRYKFDISHQDPSPEGRAAGEVVWPFNYTLDPITFSIVDKLDDREGKQQVKKIGIVEGTEIIDGREVTKKFKRVRVSEKEKGVKKFDLGKIEDREMVMYLELHPKLSGGDFSDVTKRQLFSRIDEKVAANTKRLERTEKTKALNAAQSMSDKELIDFADAMLWDSSEDIDILRNQTEDLADTNPVYFNDLVSSKAIEYQSLIKKAIDKDLVIFDPADYKFLYKGNQQTIVVLSPVSDKSEIEKFSEWLQTGGQKADEVYKKLKALVQDKKVVV